MFLAVSLALFRRDFPTKLAFWESRLHQLTLWRTDMYIFPRNIGMRLIYWTIRLNKVSRAHYSYWPVINRYLLHKCVKYLLWHLTLFPSRTEKKLVLGSYISIGYLLRLWTRLLNVTTIAMFFFSPLRDTSPLLPRNFLLSTFKMSPRPLSS